jgi:hypothetical protein
LIVRDAGANWQIVLQTDHADLSSGLARAWAERGERHDSLVVAAERHDDGWAVWEQSPAIDGDGRPITFLDVPIPVHLAFYRAGIAAIGEEDPYAGMLVSMHGAGIYRQRYGTDSMLRMTHSEEVKALVDAFVAEQEGSWGGRRAELGAGEDETWTDYRRLQLYDRFSLYFCMRDVEAGEEAEIADYRFEPVAPWRIRMAPFPFTESPARFSLLRHVLPKRERTPEDFRRELAASEPDRTELTIDP